MDAQEGVEREEARYPYDREVKLVVARCSCQILLSTISWLCLWANSTGNVWR